MKRNLVLALGLVLASTSVFATRARLEALGESKDGSFYIEDGRNIFLNAAHVNHVKDSVVFEWGDQQNYDSQTSSDAEGGYFKSHGKFTYGVYFGRQANSIEDIRSVNSNNLPGQAQLANENNVDLYLGGDAQGIEWGAALSFSNSDKDSVGANTDLSQSALALRLGAIMGATSAWANISLMNESELNNGTQVEEFDGNLGLQLGVSHAFGHGYRAYAQYRMNGADHINAIPSSTVESDLSEITVGLGKTVALNDNANLFTRIEYMQATVKLEQGAATLAKETTTSVPVVIGLEADVKEWLTVRGSVTHELWGQTKDKTANTTNSSDDSTRVAGGVTVKLGDLSVDGTVGKAAFGGVSENFSRLGVTYNF